MTVPVDVVIANDERSEEESQENKTGGEVVLGYLSSRSPPERDHKELGKVWGTANPRRQCVLSGERRASTATATDRGGLRGEGVTMGDG